MSKEIQDSGSKTEKLVERFKAMQPISGKSLKVGIGQPGAIYWALKKTGLFADVEKTNERVCNRTGRYVNVYLVSFW